MRFQCGRNSRPAGAQAFKQRVQAPVLTSVSTRTSAGSDVLMSCFLPDKYGITRSSTDHPEKVCAFTEEFATKNPKTVKAVLKALHLSSEYLDNLENRARSAEIVGRPTYINAPPDAILDRLLGKYDYGDGRKEQDPNYMIFSSRGCNYPDRIFGKWFLSQFRRWGLVKGAPDYAGIVNRVMRPDIYLEAMKEMGVTPKAADLPGFTLWDGTTFDGKDPEQYAHTFAVHSMAETA